jgi:16S rRNA (guanine527-N7)-methyltransferase
MAHKNQKNTSPMRSRQGNRHQKPQQIYSVDEANDRLFDLFRNHNFDHVSHAERRKLAEFYEILMKNQEKENFTRLLTLRDVGIRHFIDCLIIVDILKNHNIPLKFPLLDMGTGPGFPGIPLKIKFPNEKIILAEGVQRRVEFLKNVREKMNLENLDIIGRNINPYFAYPVHGVITRAVEDVGNTLSNILTSLQTGGYVYLMKGPNVGPEIQEAEQKLGEYFKLVANAEYTLPHTEHHRRLVVFQKIKMAPLPDFDDEPWPED